MVTHPFHAQIETFGFESGRPWAMDALRLLFHAPRVYAPLAHAWDVANPGTLRALRRLTDVGLVAHQGPIVIDTRTGKSAHATTRRVMRYRSTAKGARLAAAVREDPRVLEDTFSRTAPENIDGVAALLAAFDLDASHAKYGISSAHAATLSGLPTRTVKWWVTRLRREGYLRALPDRLADAREVVPEHWRATGLLARQLSKVITAYDEVPESLRVDFRLGRRRFLSDIDPARIGISGATDYDHDVHCQRIVADMLRSPSWVDGRFSIEPRLALPVRDSQRPWEFSTAATARLSYQPDAELLVRDAGRLWRTVVEYERYQSRRDAWNHIERFLGYLATATVPGESASLRFVLDSKARAESYGELLGAFKDYALRHPERLPANHVVLAAAASGTLAAAPDPLDLRLYYRVELPSRADTAGRPVLHAAEDSPYDEYFSR